MYELLNKVFGVPDNPRPSAMAPISPRSIRLAIVLVSLLCILLWKLPRFQIRHTPGVAGEKVFDDENEARKTLAQLLGGSVLLLGLYFSAKTYGLSREGQLTDRFTKAIEQLGKTEGVSPNIEVRLGAIYALERVAIDSPRDHWTIMEVLTAYVRQNASVRSDVPYAEGQKPRTDIQAILNVLGRRRTGLHRERSGHFLDLSESSLCGVNLYGASFEGVSFFQASLQGAFIAKASLKGADLRGANLSLADCSEANLKGALLSRANLSETNFEKANLTEAYLIGANLAGADLRHVDLGRAYLEHANLTEACIMYANLQNCISLGTDQIKSTDGWEYAYYSDSVRSSLGLTLEPDVEGDA